MKTMKLAVVCAAALLVSGLVSPLAAGDGDKQFTFGILYSSPTDDLTSGTQKTELDEAVGFQAAFEIMLSDMIGIEPAVSSASYDLTVVEPMFPTVNGDTSLFAVTTNVNFHFERDGGVDIYVGPTVGYAFWDDIKVDGFAVPVPADDELIVGANFGVDVPFGDGGWAFSGGLSYWSVDLGASGGDIGVSPLQARIGLGYTF